MTPKKNLNSSGMTRSLLILVFAFFGLTATNTTQAQNVRDNYLVDKIYDYNNYLVAEYFYDDEYKLIKKSVTEHLGYTNSEWAAYTDEFEYLNGRVSKIIHKDVSHNMFNYNTHLFYNEQGQLIRKEVHINGQLYSPRSA